MYAHYVSVAFDARLFQEGAKVKLTRGYTLSQQGAGSECKHVMMRAPPEIPKMARPKDFQGGGSSGGASATTSFRAGIAELPVSELEMIAMSSEVGQSSCKKDKGPLSFIA